jgi:hypothetical protein
MLRPLLTATAALLAASLAFAQGALAPTAAPAPSLRALDQIEPRLPLNLTTAPSSASATHVISTPGSYYLTGNLSAAPGKHGIEIAATGVTLDLGGYSIIGDGSVASGIVLAPSGITLAQIHIQNGQIRFFDQSGIRAVNGFIEGLTVADLQIRVGGIGVNTTSATSSRITNIEVVGGTGGILCAVNGSTVQDCSAVGGTGAGISATTVLRCQVSQFTSATTLIRGTVVHQSSVLNCTSGLGSELVGINGADVRACSVDFLSKLASGSAATTGIAGTTVADCTVRNIKSLSTGTMRGINANEVTACQVSQVGASDTAAAAPLIGIRANESASSSSVSLVGSSSHTASVTGISAVRDVLHCSVRDLQTSGSLRGITTELNCLGSSVRALTQTSVSTSSMSGISARRIEDCVASGLTMRNGFLQPVLNAPTILNSRVDNITTSGTGSIAAFGYDSVGHVTICGNTSDSADYGIYYGASTGSLTCTDNVIHHSRREGIVCSTGAPGQSRIENNTVHRLDTATGAGIFIGSTSSALVVRNRVTGGTATKYTFSTTTQSGPVVSASGTLAATVHPWANFSD